MAIYKKEGVAAAIRERQATTRATRARFPTHARFIQDHFPGRWEKIERCRMHYRVYESQDRPGHYKIVAEQCHQVPYCILCMKAQEARRVHAALDKFHRCTPASKQPRFTHIVQTAPLTDDGQGWGVAAARDFATFAKIVWRTLNEMYPGNIGALLSYHDFGERAFKKSAPHIDLTLNGWSLQDGAPTRTPTYELRTGGYDSWQAAIVRNASVLDLEARPGNLKIAATTTGARNYYRVLRYQMRELVDFRKLEYDRSRQLIWWHSYKDGARTRFPVLEFKARMAAYQWRLGQWPQGQDVGKEIHRAFGHLSKRSLRSTQKAFGGLPLPHGASCPCSECGDWERVFLDDVDREAAQRAQRWKEGGKAA